MPLADLLWLCSAAVCGTVCFLSTWLPWRVSAGVWIGVTGDECG